MKTSNSIQNSVKLPLIAVGYFAIYAVLEILAWLLGDTINPLNAVIITTGVVIAAFLTEVYLLKNKISDYAEFLGIGKPALSSILTALGITAVLFVCYPVITLVTGYKFIIPGNWFMLAVGVFALHGIAEEILYRRFLFGNLRKKFSFWKAAWIAVIFFTAAHVPIIISQGIFVGGTAVLLAIASSFPLSLLYEKGGNTIWAPAIVHAAIDTVIPILSQSSMDSGAQQAVMIWMCASMIIPYVSFIIFKQRKH
jgi:membrane protease YdiL (CAAX protease family)